MKHTIRPAYTDEDGDLIPAVEVEVPEVIYLQVENYEEEGEPAAPSERTFNDSRIMDSDVVYVPLAHVEKAKAERHQLHRAWSDARDEIDTLRARLAAAAPQWLPVSPPPPDGAYLISEWGNTEVAIYHGGKWRYSKPLGEYAYPQYYQPLPAHPEDTL